MIKIILFVKNPTQYYGIFHYKYKLKGTVSQDFLYVFLGFQNSFIAFVLHSDAFLFCVIYFIFILHFLFYLLKNALEFSQISQNPLAVVCILLRWL
jgi:hypothetical protein